MDIKSLMVGDWVIFHNSGYASDNTIWKEDRICQIDGIDRDVRVKWIEEDGTKEDWPHVSITDLSPIPLTLEILEKNGFVFHPEERGMYNVIVAPYYKLERCPFRVWADGDPFSIWFDDPVDIKYVHQLQHALRLCGIEKEIVI